MGEAVAKEAEREGGREIVVRSASKQLQDLALVLVLVEDVVDDVADDVVAVVGERGDAVRCLCPAGGARLVVVAAVADLGIDAVDDVEHVVQRAADVRRLADVDLRAALVVVGAGEELLDFALALRGSETRGRGVGK